MHHCYTPGVQNALLADLMHEWSARSLHKVRRKCIAVLENAATRNFSAQKCRHFTLRCREACGNRQLSCTVMCHVPCHPTRLCLATDVITATVAVRSSIQVVRWGLHHNFLQNVKDTLAGDRSAAGWRFASFEHLISSTYVQRAKLTVMLNTCLFIHN